MADSRIPKEVIERVSRWRGRIHPFDRIEPPRTALLVVDMQTAFLAPPSGLPSARAIVPTVNRLAKAMHKAGGHVVWLISTYGPAPQDRWSLLFDHIFSREHGDRFRAGLTEGAEGHAIWPELQREPADAVVSKNRFGGFSGSRGGLERLLRDKNIDNVLIAGTVTNVCCETTAREAAMLDFKTTMVSDANAGRSAESDWHTFGTFLQIFGDVLSAEEIIHRLGIASP